MGFQRRTVNWVNEELNEKKSDNAIEKFIKKYRKDVQLNPDESLAIKNKASAWNDPTKFLKELARLEPKKIEFSNNWLFLHWE